jgi:hypothetical protein
MIEKTQECHRKGENAMKEYLLLLPIIFIFHDMEEIIGFPLFFRKNPDVFGKYPKLTAAYRDITNEGFAVAVYEEFIPFFGVSVLAYYFPSAVLYAVWYGIMLSLTLHFVLHLIIPVYVGKFIPSVLTSCICLPVCILIMIKTAPFLTFDPLTVSLIVLTVPAMMANGKLAHKLMHLFSRWMNKNIPA